MITVPDPPMITLPCSPTLPSVAAGFPLIKTVDDTAELIGLPQADGSPWRAAGKPSKKTSGEPSMMEATPCPGIGHVVGSVTRAAGFPLIVPNLGKVAADQESALN